MNTVTIPKAELLARLDAEHWVKESWDDADGKGCLHQHIRWCHPVPGDAYLIQQVTNRLGVGSGEWQDAPERTLDDVRAWVATAEITDTDLELTFGPNWQAVVALVRRAAILTDDEVRALAAARGAAWDATPLESSAHAAAWDAALPAWRNPARGAAWDAAWNVSWDPAQRAAARDTALYAAEAVVVAGQVGTGGLTQDHLDTLLGPWRQVIGDPLHPDTIQRWLAGER